MRTELPEKWCIEITKENLEVLNNWRTHHTLTQNEMGEFLMYPDYPKSYNDAVGYCVPENPGVVEITFEEFKHFILKENLPKENYKYLTTFLRKLNIT